jgi:protein-disulfide isomerase
MPLSRRSLVTAAATGLAIPALDLTPLGRAALADDDLTHADRAIGLLDAKVTVDEHFSLTCSHCAAFSKEVLPKIKAELIDTGKMRWVFRDYPLDQVALTAAMVARYLPVARYEPFVSALLASQDRWVFARGVNPVEELWKFAALAGMNRALFDKAITDDALRTWILEQQKEASTRLKIDATPNFVVGGRKYTGPASFEGFSQLAQSG